MQPFKEPVFISILAVVSILAFVPVLTYAYFANSLGSKESIMNRNSTGVVLEDRSGKPFFKFYNSRSPGIYVPISQIPKHAQDAVIAAEDREFRNHPGFSIKGIAGAVLADIKNQTLIYGGSTITQQLVKNSLLSTKRNFLRKYQELVLAQEIERRHGKDEILEMYLNSVYFGQGAFGIGSAAQTYFNKPVQDLNLAEASILAGLVTAPSRLSPINGDKQASARRQHFVLDEMVQNKMISKKQAEEAKQAQLEFNPTPEPFPFRAPHFAFMVRDELINKYGEESVARSGFKVKTTIDLDWQDFAENVVKEQVQKLAPNKVTNGSAVVIDPKTGEIKTLVGSKDWGNDKFGKVNIATSIRQPGSSFKPIVYIAALEQGIITPATILLDSPTTFKSRPGSPPYAPLDYDRKFRGPVTVRRALANSLNIPAVQVLEKLGVSNALDMAERLGISTLKDQDRFGLSLVLGAGEVELLEMTNTYATFASGGLYNKPTTILEIKDKYNNQIFEHKQNPQRVINPEYTFLLSSILSDVGARKEIFGNVLDTSRPAAVKTGTSENYRDSLTIGYTPSLAVGAWVGDNLGAQLDRVAGSIGAAPIWKALMEEFLKNTPAENFEIPENIALSNTCRLISLNGKVASTSSNLKEYFAKGTEPKGSCPSRQSPAPSPSPSVSPTPSPSPALPSPASPAPDGASPSPSSSPSV